MRQSGVLWKQVGMILHYVLYQTIFKQLAMNMSIGCPWARGSFPLAITSKADPAGDSIGPPSWSLQHRECGRRPDTCAHCLLPNSAGPENVERNLDHSKIIDGLDSTNKSQEARLIFEYA